MNRQYMKKLENYSRKRESGKFLLNLKLQMYYGGAINRTQKVIEQYTGLGEPSPNLANEFPALVDDWLKKGSHARPIPAGVALFSESGAELIHEGSQVDREFQNLSGNGRA